jgi:Ca2+-transporting ATPase
MIEGLSEKEVFERRKKYGQNIFPQKEKVQSFQILISQFKNPLIYILLFVGFISLIFKEFFDFGLIIVVVILNIAMGFFQEYNAKKTLIALKSILKPKATVIREGEKKEIEIKDLVPGDIVVLIGGDKVPADGKLIEGEILVSEAVLTGEEEAILKNSEETPALFMGSQVLSGKGIMEVTKIGTETEIGKIGKTLAEIKEEKTPLQQKMEKLSKSLAQIILVVCFFIFLSQIFQKGELLKSFEIAIVLAVAAIPAALPVALTLILALGMRRILKKKGLAKSLFTVETLGSISVICTDKTGTLTEGKMKIVKTYFLNEEKAILGMILNNEQKSSLEIALWNFAKENKKEFKKLLKISREIYEEPFDSQTKYMMSIQEVGNKKIAFLNGAPEVILKFCKNSSSEKRKISEKLDNFAREGLRVVGLAFKEEGNLKEKREFLFSGLIGILDPLRKEAKEMIERAQKAKIKVKIVTGDYRKTAEKIAQQLGFKIEGKNIMESSELEKISKEELKERIDDIILFTRVTPHQKRKIVDCLQEKGEVVAMTGDGVNDALALKEADVGVVVGTGTEVAKEAGDLVLLDNNFKTIIAACEEGRSIFTNIKKTVGYMLSNSFLEISVIFLAGILKLPPPLTIVQILWLHLICDGPPDLTFAFEPKEKDLMERKPIDVRKEPVLDKSLLSLMGIVTIFVTLLAIPLYWYFGIKNQNLTLGRTLVFATLASIDLIYILSFKNLRKTIPKMENFLQNKFLFFSIMYGFLLLFVAIYIPFFNKILGTSTLTWWHWILVFGIGIATTLILEISKSLHKSFKNND